MQDISKIIEIYLPIFREGCSKFDSPQCKREGGCVCELMSEIRANIYTTLPPEYRNSDFNQLTGKVKNQVIDRFKNGKLGKIKHSLWQYLFGDNPIKLNLSRSDFDKISIMDKRFKDGSCLLIHGNPIDLKKEDDGKIKSIQSPTGKTLMASIAMKEAIFRRQFKSNEAFVYHWISFIELRQKLKAKNDEDVNDCQECDWLVIDDISVIDDGSRKGDGSWVKTAFDSFLISRLKDRKPTILVCRFDLDAINVVDCMGLAFNKIYTSENTVIIKV